jgi:broad specificity phosphatase PhoE
MTRIILVRHGQTAWNSEERFRGHADIPLDETGFAQAEAVSKRLAMQWKPDDIYAGPLSRTIQTAEPTARYFNLPVQIEPGLIDVDCGEWRGLTPREAGQRWPAEFNAYLHRPAQFQFPGGESLENARLRAIRRVTELASTHRNQTIMLVSHTALNRLILLSVLGMDSSGFWKIRQDTCAINSFDLENENFLLGLLNETSHLLTISSAFASVNSSKTV